MLPCRAFHKLVDLKFSSVLFCSFFHILSPFSLQFLYNFDFSPFSMKARLISYWFIIYNVLVGIVICDCFTSFLQESDYPQCGTLNLSTLSSLLTFRLKISNCCLMKMPMPIPLNSVISIRNSISWINQISTPFYLLDFQGFF